MTLTIGALVAGGIAPTQARTFIEPLLQTCDMFGITTPMRQAAFLAQLSHESGGFQHTEESLWYRTPERIVAMFSGVKTVGEAQRYVGKPRELANLVYAGRMGNGDVASGDGWRFRGRGLIQLTGRNNYTAAALKLAEPYVDQPDLVALPADACLTAGWFWDRSGLNKPADQGAIDQNHARHQRLGDGRREGATRPLPHVPARAAATAGGAPVMFGLIAKLAAPWRLYAELAIAGLLLAALGAQTVRLSGAHRDVEAARRLHAEHLAADERATREAEQAARFEESRRTAAHREIADEAQRMAARGRADSAAADDAARRVRDRAEQLAAACPSAGDPTPAAGSAPAAGPGLVLADMLRRADARAGELARYADEARIAGLACERAYDSLTLTAQEPLRGVFQPRQ
ncbi:MAG: DUF2514 family protein [Rubrivivax sp.]